MEIIIPVNYLIVFHSALVQCGTPSWYVEYGVYHTNTRSFFTLDEQDYNIVNEVIEIIISN